VHLAAGAVTCCVTLGWCSAARAQAPGLHVAYSAPPECPDRAEFLRQVELRLSKPAAQLKAHGEPRFSATMNQSGGAVQGTLVVIEPDGARSVRDVPGRSCTEVVAAMSLITALTLDPNASTAPLPKRSRPPRPKPTTPPAPPTARSRGWQFGFGIDVGVATAVAPSAAPTLQPSVAFSDDAARIVAPAFRLSVMRSTGSTVQTRLGQAEFVWTAARLSVCPLKWPARSALELRPCAILDAGVLNGNGSKTNNPASAAARWLAPGLTLRLSYHPVAALSLELEGGATFPLQRDRFFFSPDVQAFHVPPAGVIGSVGVAAWLP
jgi:hypothetical protein